MANPGDMLSIPVRHFGVLSGFFGPPMTRHCRAAMISKATPTAILTARAANAGPVLGFGGSLPVANNVRPMATATDSWSRPDDLPDRLVLHRHFAAMTTTGGRSWAGRY
jgi:hypothetical protein